MHFHPSLPRRSLFAALFLMAVGPGATRCVATVWMPPIRPLTTEERFEMAASASDAAALGTISSLRDSVDREGLSWRWFHFAPSNWLKGSGPSSDFRIYFPQISNFGYETARGALTAGSAPCLVFLRHVVGPSAEYWALSENPEFPGGGLLAGEAADKSAAQRAAQAIANLSPDSLARHSSEVVLGEVSRSSTRINYKGNKLTCSSVVVESWIDDGSHKDATIRVYSLFGALETTGRALLILRPGQGGAYEVVGFNSGVMPVVGDSVPSVNSDLQSLLGRVRRAMQQDLPPGSK